MLLILAMPARSDTDTLEQGRTQYKAENFEEALVLLREAYVKQKGPPVTRLLGLAYYHLLRYEEARPLLEAALHAYPTDSELAYALADVLLELGQPAAALTYVQQLREIAPKAARTHALAGRVYLALGQERKASAALERALELDPATSGTLAADLTRLYAGQGKVEQARQIAQSTIDAAPDTFETEQLRRTLRELSEVRKPLAIHLGYRFENDSNVVLEPDNTVVVLPRNKGKSDTRNIFFADLLGQYSLGPHWDIFGEAHLYRSIYNQLEAYDQTRQNYVLSLGWSAPTYGFRAPYEFTNVRLNGEPYLTAHTVTPGAYVRLNDITLHGFFRYQHNDFTEDVRLSEDRSGDERGPGALLLWPFHSQRGLLRVLFEAFHVDTRGRNWERDEYNLLAQASYSWSPRFNTNLGFQLTKWDFDNIHDIFLVRRDDEAYELFAGVNYRLYKNWELNLQAAWVNWDSNIDIYKYPRTVVAVGLSVHF
jgi:tetratricopeptide (TPR) repeat protein